MSSLNVSLGRELEAIYQVIIQQVPESLCPTSPSVAGSDSTAKQPLMVFVLCGGEKSQKLVKYDV